MDPIIFAVEESRKKVKETPLVYLNQENSNPGIN